MGAESETIVKIRYFPMSGLLSGTLCLMENAWICFSLCLEEAQYCKRAMHLVRMCGVGFCGVVEKKDEKLKEGKWFLGLWKNEENFEDTFICFM